MKIHFKKAENPFRVEHELKAILAYLVAIPVVWFTLFQTIDNLTVKFNPDKFITIRAVLKADPQIVYSSSGSYIELDKVRHLQIPTSYSEFKEQKFLSEVKTGDTIWYSVRKSDYYSYDGKKKIEAIGKGETTYLALDHLLIHDTWQRKLLLKIFCVFLAILPLYLAFIRFFIVTRTYDGFTVQLKGTKLDL